MNIEWNEAALNGKSSTEPRLRVVLADDHELVREGLRLLVSCQPDIEVVGEASDGETAFRLARDIKPDVVVMDVVMPGVSGAQATERLRAACPRVKVLALSAYQDEPHVRQTLESGAAGYLLKNAGGQELARAIRLVANGGRYIDPQICERLNRGQDGDFCAAEENLSSREREVLRLTAWGYTNKEIASDLHLSVKTVEGHKSRLMDKLALGSRADLVRYAVDRGWLA